MKMSAEFSRQKKLLLFCLPALLPLLLYTLGYSPSLPRHPLLSYVPLLVVPGPPLLDPRALAEYKPANWSRVLQLPWNLHLPPANTSTCSWPVLDPWHPDILKYVTDRPGDRVNCTNKQKTLLYTSMDRLILNITALHELDMKREDVRCTFVYTNSTDGLVGDGPVVELEGDEMVLNPRNLSLFATCNHTVTERQIYQNMLFYLPARTEKPVPTNTTQYSVSILLIDATSQMNMIRTLPKTRTALEQLGGLVFKGYHKVAEGSNPNVRALFTGQSNEKDATAGEEFMPSKYRQRGWTTMYMQDAASIIWPKIGQNFTMDYEDPYQWLQNTGQKYRSNHCIAWQALDDAWWGWKKKGCDLWHAQYRCLQEQLQHKHQFRVIENFNMFNRDRPSFHFVHLCQYTHDDQNMTPLYDTDLAAMLTQLTDNAALKTTFFFLMADHGFRMGSPFQETKQGIIENNMPMLAIIPPPDLGATHPNMLESMKKNTEELTTHWDVHRTLRHILSMSVGEEHKVRSPGISLLTPVGTRTCPEAEVPPQWCSCTSGWNNLEPANVTDLVSAVLADINEALAPLRICETLALEEVTEASSKTVGKETIIEVNVVVLPSSAHFSVSVVFPAGSSDLKAAVVTVTRADMYRFTSLCVGERQELQSICLCRDRA